MEIVEQEEKQKKKIPGLQVSRIPKMREDVRRNLKTVASFLVKNPEAKIVQIQEATKLSYNAVKRAMDNMSEYLEKDDRIMMITERDLEIVFKGQEELNRRFEDPVQMKAIKTSDLVNAMEKSEKRYMLFRGDATNKEGGLKTITSIEII